MFYQRSLIVERWGFLHQQWTFSRENLLKKCSAQLVTGIALSSTWMTQRYNCTTLYCQVEPGTHLTRLMIPLHHGCTSGRKPPWIERLPSRKKTGQMLTGRPGALYIRWLTADVESTSMLHVAFCSYFCLVDGTSREKVSKLQASSRIWPTERSNMHQQRYSTVHCFLYRLTFNNFSCELT